MMFAPACAPAYYRRHASPCSDASPCGAGAFLLPLLFALFILPSILRLAFFVLHIATFAFAQIAFACLVGAFVRSLLRESADACESSCVAREKCEAPGKSSCG